TFQIKKATIVDPARFWSKVDRSAGPIACWPWTGRREAAGYGSANTKTGRRKAHRVAYSLTKGPLLSGMSVCHACDNPCCVNPAHLWLGTHRENMRDRATKGRGGNLKGVANGRAKLTDQSVSWIRLLKARGLTNRQIADAFGVTD